MTHMPGPSGNGPNPPGGTRHPKVTHLHPRTAQASVRVAGVVVVDLSKHVNYGTLMAFQQTIFVPTTGYAPGTNIEIHIGHAERVHPGDANLRTIVAAAHPTTTIVVKGFEADGVMDAQRVLSRLAGLTQRPERLGCEHGACELLYGPADAEGPRR